MKILHVSKKYPPAIGGDAVVVANLQKQQESANHQVVIVTSNCAEISDGTGIYKVGLKDTPAALDAITIKRIVSLVILSLRMFVILRKERPNVIHTHSVDMAFFASFAARFYHIPIVQTFHVVTFYDATQSALRRKSELWLAKRANPHFVTAPNNYDVQKLHTAGLTQAILLPNGVDLEFWKLPAVNPKNEAFTFLAVGRLEHQKGYDYLIKAAMLLAKKTRATFRVVIVGEGSQEKALHALAHTLNAKDIVQFAGGKSPRQTRNLLGQADAIVCPSLYETTPLTLLEAWSGMIPVIITPVGILRDASTDFKGAFLVQPKNVLSLMQTMAKCMDDDVSRQNAIAEGYEEAKKYAWPLVSKRAEIFYQATQ
jgi:glycosyltransferase involved in cell wall biosynthesis